MLMLLGVLLTSSVVLGLELVFMRVLSISHWHHFAYMIISVALLGFGVSGTFITLARRVLLRHVRTSMAVCALLLSASVPASFHLAQRVPFNVLAFGWDSRQYLYLAESYVLYLVPFFFGACVIGLALADPDASGRIGVRYAVNLVGTGLGALGTVLLMHVLDVPGLMRTLALLAGLAALLLVLSERGRVRAAIVGAGVLAAAAVSLACDFDLKISEYKTLAHYQRLEAQHDARTIARRFSPLGRIDVIESPYIHATPPGLSLNFTGDLPPQRLLIFDGEGSSAVSQIDNDLANAAFLDYTTAALAYHLVERPRVAVVGPGGGGPVLLARRHDARSVTAVELDPEVIALMRGPLRPFGGEVFDAPGVRVVCAEGRSFFETTTDRFDMIELALVDSLAASAAGTNALNESYLYTVEALKTYLTRLTDEGLLSLTRWLRSRPVPAATPDEPPDRMEETDVVKLLAGLARAMRELGLEPGPRVVVIRGWATATVVARRRPFTPDELAAVRVFAADRGFDLVYLPDIRPEETNRFTILKEPLYYLAAQALLVGDADGYIRAHPFAVQPATDDRPYFFDFFRWRLLVPLVRSIPTSRDWVPFVDWGYVALVATLVQAVILGVLLIVVPLFFIRKAEGTNARPPRRRAGIPARQPQRRTGMSGLPVLGYFVCLGVAFMFLEMTYIQRMIRFLWHPVYSVSVVVTGFLVFAGIGSVVAERWPAMAIRKITVAVGGICVIAAAEQFLLPVMLASAWKMSFAVRAGVALVAIAPLAFFMGMPFPTGLTAVSQRRPELLPWAWGVNGCASVVATVLATVLAVSWGFRPVTWIALTAYVLAGVAAVRLMRPVVGE